ncbi:hypothetical protein [Burkholderia guangdongensis]|uniref:hypothetical protein n=1 Tax=Burkholderia guangdongensis TaxID=1792500 RepID=UPI0015CB0D80|nr:hypothetical protein [Burkholderia guangdongensis]
MLESLVSFVAGAMEAYFQQRRTKPLNVFLVTFSLFTVIPAIGLPLSAPAGAPERSWVFIIVLSAGSGLFMGLLMITLLHIHRRKSKTAQLDQ